MSVLQPKWKEKNICMQGQSENTIPAANWNPICTFLVKGKSSSLRLLAIPNGNLLLWVHDYIVLLSYWYQTTFTSKRSSDLFPTKPKLDHTVFPLAFTKVSLTATTHPPTAWLVSSESELWWAEDEAIKFRLLPQKREGSQVSVAHTSIRAAGRVGKGWDSQLGTKHWEAAKHPVSPARHLIRAWTALESRKGMSPHPTTPFPDAGGATLPPSW